jgi:hypothetical protein
VLAWLNEGKPTSTTTPVNERREDLRCHHHAPDPMADPATCLNVEAVIVTSLFKKKNKKTIKK